MNKREIRTQMLARRKRVTPEEASVAAAAVAERVMALPEVERLAGRVGGQVRGRVGGGVMVYESRGSELGTRGLIDELLGRGVPVAVPWVEGGWTGWTPDAEMGVRWLGGEAVAGEMAVVVVPGLAFTRRGDRLGRGAGHYDRWFALHRTPRMTLVGVGYDWQLIDDLPVEPHDVTMDAVVVPGEVVRG